MERRAFLGATLVGSVAAALVEALPRAGRAAGVEGWRAFEVITRVRFAHHAELIAAGSPADNLIDPSELTPITRTDLREALNVVKRAQKRIGASAPTAR